MKKINLKQHFGGISNKLTILIDKISQHLVKEMIKIKIYLFNSKIEATFI